MNQCDSFIYAVVVSRCSTGFSPFASTHYVCSLFFEDYSVARYSLNRHMDLYLLTLVVGLRPASASIDPGARIEVENMAWIRTQGS